MSAYYWMEKHQLPRNTVHPAKVVTEGNHEDLFSHKRGGFQFTPLPYILGSFCCLFAMCEPSVRVAAELVGLTDLVMKHLGVGAVALAAFGTIFFFVFVICCVLSWVAISFIAYVRKGSKALALHNLEREAWVRPVIAPVDLEETQVTQVKKPNYKFVKPSKQVPERVTGCSEGIPFDRLVNLTPENLEKSGKSEFVCMICHNIAADPVMTTCEHLFCYACIQKWARELDTDWGKCPACYNALGLRRVDGNFFNLDQFYPEERELYLGIIVTCQSEKCGWKGPLQDLKAHWDKECTYNEKPDPETTVDAKTRMNNLKKRMTSDMDDEGNEETESESNSDEDEVLPGEEEPPEPVTNVALETARENQEMLSKWLSAHHNIDKPLVIAKTEVKAEAKSEGKAESKSDAGEKGAEPEVKEYVTQDRAHKALLPQYQVCVCVCK